MPISSLVIPFKQSISNTFKSFPHSFSYCRTPSSCFSSLELLFSLPNANKDSRSDKEDWEEDREEGGEEYEQGTDGRDEQETEGRDNNLGHNAYLLFCVMNRSNESASQSKPVNQ